MTRSTQPQSLLRFLTVLIGSLLAAGMLALSAPTASHAQSGCPLPARLQIGDPVEVIDGTANTLRYGPGLGYAKMHLRIVPGDVWIVQDGPVCADGIYWYNVGAYDAAGWTAEGVPGQGYYLGRTNRPFGEDLGSTPICASDRLSIGMRVMVGDGKNQRVRPQPTKAAREIAWLAPGVPVTLLDGPRCADGWIWWSIADDTGRIRGWTAEGDGRTPWLVPARGSAAGGGSTGGAVSGGAAASTAVTRPKLAGQVRISSTLSANAAISPDEEAVTVIFDNFEVRATPAKPQVTRSETITIPVRSDRRGYIANPTIVGMFNCGARSYATVTVRAGNATQTATCQGLSDLILPLDVVQPANADLRITVTVQVGGIVTPDSAPWVTIDLIDLRVDPR